MKCKKKNGYRFRIKFKLPRNDYIDIKEGTEVVIPFPNGRDTIIFRSINKNTKSGIYTLNGGPYETEDIAKEIANRALNALFLYSVKTGRGIDIGFNAPKTALTGYGQEYYSKKTGFKVLQDVYGIHVYPNKSSIKF